MKLKIEIPDTVIKSGRTYVPTGRIEYPKKGQYYMTNTGRTMKKTHNLRRSKQPTYMELI